MVTAESQRWRGIDLGDRHSQLCLVDATGAVIEEARLATTQSTFTRRFGAMEPVRVAIEVGTHSPWVSRLLSSLGHEVIVANARKLRLIYENDSKDDRVDAEYLARLARLDPKLLAPIQHRGKQTQEDLALLRARDALVRTRVDLVNHVRGAVKSVGGRVPKCSTASFAQKAASHLPEELACALGPILGTIGGLTQAIRGYDTRIEAIAEERYPATKLLRQVAGVGPITALCFVLTIEDPDRFKKSRAVGAYLGMRPKKGQSGASDPEKRITKAGDVDLRRLLVTSAHYILGPFGPDTDLRRWGLALAEKGAKNQKKRAILAVARKLSVLLHRLWVTGEVYEPLRNTKRHRRREALKSGSQTS